MAKAIHLMVRVRDAARSIRFYRDAFGMDVADRFDFEGFERIRNGTGAQPRRNARPRTPSRLRATG